jgi:AraC-like DNA-binding protein
MTTSVGRVAARLVRPLVLVARKHGLDAASLCEEAGVDLATLEDPEGRVPYLGLRTLTEVVAREVRSPALGLELARVSEPYSAQDPMSMVMLASRTVREGYSRVLRYQRLWDDQNPFTLEPCEGGARLGFKPPEISWPLLRVNMEWMAGSALLTVRALTGKPLSPSWVHFQHEAPPDLSVYEDFFGAPVTFGAPSMEIAFPDSVLDQPLTEANAILLSFFEKNAEVKAAQLPTVHLLSAQVQAVLRGALGGGDYSLKAVAAKLRMSPRTLQRRLKEEGTHHEQLLEELRRELAGTYLGKRLDIAEVSYLLGYANPTAFHRAFKRWMGESPEAYRARLVSRTPLQGKDRR